MIATLPTPAAADVQFHLARVWEHKGHTARALLGYRHVLELDPAHLAARTSLGRLLLVESRLSEALAVFREGLELDPTCAEFHKGLIVALVAQDGLARAFAFYELSQSSPALIELEPHALLCCSVVHNEALRLPFFLDYYRRLGVSRFLMVDNNSTDDTPEFLLAQPDVYVWRTSFSFQRANFGAAWFQVLLEAYGRNHWCVIADADELLVYPEAETRSLPVLCAALDRHRKRVLTALLVDMYSDKPIKDTPYARGEDLRQVCPFFDRTVWHTRYEAAGPYKNQTAYFGGVRQRVLDASGGYYLSKVALLKYAEDVIFAGGQHWTNLPAEQIATARGALLHFKFIASFPTYVAQEVARQQHYGNAMQYTGYAQALAKAPGLTLYDPQFSVRYQDSRQLVALGIMEVGESATDAAAEHASTAPRILPVTMPERRPLWSVMLTVYNRLSYLEQALCSVLDAAPGPDEMQIEVIADGADDGVRAHVQSLVNRFGRGRVTFFSPAHHVGHPTIFNVCLERGRGHWVHILHDDDWVEPEFYRALERGIYAEPTLGAAFCRHTFADENGQPLRLSWLERETPGVLTDWLERIAVFCRVQTPAMVVKRAAYEQLGGYNPIARSAFDWEMWMRLAAQYPVWYEPTPLANFREHAGSASTPLVRGGTQIADARRAIELAQGYLPAECAAALARRAYTYYAGYALDLAKQQAQRGDSEAALANLQQGLLCSQAPEILNELIALLTQLQPRA